jgi:hypothetical protein
MESNEDVFSDDFSSPLMAGLQRGDSNRSWKPQSQVVELDRNKIGNVNFRSTIGTMLTGPPR